MNSSECTSAGDKNENGMDTLVIGENYSNHETLGKLTIRKTGEVLAGWKTEAGALDPWMTGEAEDGNFVYETRPLAGAEYTITAAEDIYTQDRQTDNYGNRTLWYAKGDVVAVVTTGNGSADIATFAPARTKATYDFLSVIHDGTIGEVSVTLPLGSYHIEETKPPYGYVGTSDSYDVTFVWDAQLNDMVMATSIAKYDGAASSQSFEVVRSKDANADFIEQQTLKFYNDREKAKVGVYKVDRETGKYLAGAVFNLYTADDIYSVDGKLLFAAGELVATSPETWVRSLVPKLKKSASLAISPAVRAARGISIMVPTSYFMSTPAAAIRASAVLTTTSLTNFSSLTSPTRGIMMWGVIILPVSAETLRAALMTALVCISAISG